MKSFSPFEDLGCFSGCLITSTGIQKLFCVICSAFKCSFDEFVGDKAFSPSYSSAILAPPHFNGFLIATPFSFSYFFSFVLLFVSVIRYCYGFYLAITLF